MGQANSVQTRLHTLRRELNVNQLGFRRIALVVDIEAQRQMEKIRNYNTERDPGYMAALKRANIEKALEERMDKYGAVERMILWIISIITNSSNSAYLHGMGEPVHTVDSENHWSFYLLKRN